MVELLQIIHKILENGNKNVQKSKINQKHFIKMENEFKKLYQENQKMINIKKKLNKHKIKTKKKKHQFNEETPAQIKNVQSNIYNPLCLIHEGEYIMI